MNLHHPQLASPVCLLITITYKCPGAFGEVTVGQRADLVLLESNPMEDVSATRQRLGVMSRRRWYSQDELDRLVAELIASYE